jgi:hypothetical protein
MPTKLLRAFIAALAIAAFAALPLAAMAENVTLKEGSQNLEPEDTIRATSTNFTFTGRESKRVVACATTSIRGMVRENPGGRITFRNEGRFDNAAGGDQCPLAGTGGRISFRESVTFREDITLQKTGTQVEGRTTARFTFRFFDRQLEPEGPIAACSYEGPLEFTNTIGSDSFKVKSEENAILETSVGECDEEAFFQGDFRLTRRDGTTPVKTN